MYDQVRRPRTQRIVESSRETGRIVTGLNKDIGLDLKKLREGLLPRWDFIIDFDNEKHRDEAFYQRDYRRVEASLRNKLLSRYFLLLIQSS